MFRYAENIFGKLGMQVSLMITPIIDDNQIIFILPARLGDTIFHIPALTYLKANRPNLHITALATSSLSGQTLANCPAITELLLATPENIAKLSAQDMIVLCCHELPELIKRFQTRPNRVRCHFVRQDIGSPQSEQILYWVCEQFALTQPTTTIPYQLYPTTQDEIKAQQLLLPTGYQPDRDLLIACHLGCHGMAQKKHRWWWRRPTHHKTWSVAQFIELALHLQQQLTPKIYFVLTGSETELPLAKEFSKKVPYTINVMGKTSVLELASILQKVALLITPDTGVLHVACAMDTPLIALFGSRTSVAVTGPYPQALHRRVIQKASMADITPVEVARVGEKMLVGGSFK